MHSTGTGQPVETQDVFFWRLAGRSAPTGLAIVHWIGCINAIKLCFSIFGKNSKIQNGRHFWGGENFLKIVSTLIRYPVGRKSRRNRSISHGQGDRSKFVFFHFWQKFKNSKWPPFLGRGKFFENCQEYIPQIPCGSKISTKSLYVARLRR